MPAVMSKEAESLCLHAFLLSLFLQGETICFMTIKKLFIFFIFIDIVGGSGAITLSSNVPFNCLMSRWINPARCLQTSDQLMAPLITDEFFQSGDITKMQI